MANDYEISINQDFVEQYLAKDFFMKPARYYLTFGKTSQTHAMLTNVMSQITVANSRQVKEFSMPNIYFMRNDEGITRKGIIIELPKPFYDKDYSFILLLYVGVKYYYITAKYDYIVHGFYLCDIDPELKLTNHKAFVSSPQDLWNKALRMSKFEE